MAKTPSKTNKYRENFLRSFAYACRLIQDDGHIFPVHYELADFAQTELETGDTHRMLLIMPRGSYKTTFVTKFLPIWLAMKNPNIRILIVSNTLPNAKQKVSEIRQMMMTHPVISGLFPELIPNVNNVRWSDACAEIVRSATFSEGTFESAGLRSTLTGRHYDVIIEDDTVAPNLDDLDRDIVLPSREDINQAIGWHKLATPLLTDAYRATRIVVGTRWCYDDLLEYIQDNEDEYAVFSRQAVEDGVPLIDRFDEIALADIKKSLGTYMFSALYMNQPVRPEDMLFRPEWISQSENMPYNLHEGEPNYDPAVEPIKWVITIDPAISDKKSACDTALIRCGHRRGKLYVTECLCGKFTPMQTIQKTIELIMLDINNTKWIGVESVAYQKALAMFLKDEMNRLSIYKPVMPINSNQNKHERIQGLQPFFEYSQIIIRKGLDELVSQLIQYPHGKLIDCIDALAMQLESYMGFKPELEQVEVEPKQIEDGRQIQPTTVEDILTHLYKDRRQGLMATGTDSGRTLMKKGLKK